ncbi:MAG TPA: nickel pincer cofactor biosynthesis protein LarC [Spirochaetota bacterium]|nr:nickel pincer cofactor biosynthesis protein LarC [Spirochaetota bacterium]
MKTLYCDIQLGASGDMLIGALLDACLPVDVLQQQLSSLPFTGFAIAPVKQKRYGVTGTQAGITAAEDTHYRDFTAIKKIIAATSCSDTVKNNATAIFETLATAESEVHGIAKDEVHFHEVGAADSIIDILAFCIAIEYLNVDAIYYSNFALGSGTITTQHGVIPLPAPAVVKLTHNKQVTFTFKNGELTTPTAAAILVTLGTQQPSFSGCITATGIGFGTRDYGFPGYTRTILLDKVHEEESNCQHEVLHVIECNIDDMNPELVPFVADMLLEAGALDVYYHQVIMKKGRPGVVLWALCTMEKTDTLQKIIFSQTTTLGVRAYPVNRSSLSRQVQTVTVYGEKVTIKLTSRYNELSPKPEFEDCKRLALKTGKTVRTIMEEALKEYYKHQTL